MFYRLLYVYYVLLILLIFSYINHENLVFPVFFQINLHRFPVKVTSKSLKKAQTLKATISVKNPSVAFTDSVNELTVGATAKVAATATPATAKVNYYSADKSIATVGKTSGTVTAKAEGTVKVAAVIKTGTKTTKVYKEITVKQGVATLTAVKQTASNAFIATFSADASKTITKDDITVKAADNTVELPVKSVEYAKDGLSAVVTLQNNFVDAQTYKIAAKDASFDLTAKVGAVSEVVIKTTQAQKNVATPINFTLVDKDGIDVTPSVSVDSTCNVTVDGAYSSAEIDKASAAKITMANVGDKANVTITYSTNAKDAQDVTKTQEIVCVNAEATTGTEAFIVSGGAINLKSESAKFYNTDSATEVKVEEQTNKDVFFCAKQDDYTAVSYDSYEVESANDSIATATISGKDAGKYAVINVQGNTTGKTQLNVTAIKNDAKTTYTIPVTVTKKLEAVKMTVEVDKSVMSDVDDYNYLGKVKAKLYDSDNQDVTNNGSFTYEVTTTDPNGKFDVYDKTEDSHLGNGEFYVNASGASARTYTIKITGSDAVNGTGKTFTKSVNVQVKTLPSDAYSSKGIALTYQIEMDKTSLDQNKADKSYLNAKLYATYNGLFAGYVRKTTDGKITVAGGYPDDSTKGVVAPTTTTTLRNVEVAAKFGTVEYGVNTTSGFGTLYDTTYVRGQKESGLAVNGFSDITYDSSVVFESIDNRSSRIDWSLDGTKNVGLAKEGSYTLAYKLYYQKDAADKFVLKTNVFKVTNSIVKPKVKVVKNAVSDVNDSSSQYETIRKNGLLTNVDMNNNDVENNPAIVDLADTKANTNNTSRFVKYAVVEDNYGSQIWHFYTAVNATFKTE